MFLDNTASVARIGCIMVLMSSFDLSGGEVIWLVTKFANQCKRDNGSSRHYVPRSLRINKNENIRRLKKQ